MKDYWDRMTVVTDARPDLGGNLRHGDSRSITPAFCEYLVQRFSVRSVLDVGAGEGHVVNIFHRLGVFAHGIDGLDENVQNAQAPVALHDLTKAPYTYPCDLSYCVEVVEHIEERHLDNLLGTLSNAPVIVMTHAVPGQPGHHHVNNQPESYWIEKLKSLGYTLAIDNDWFRELARKEKSDCYFGETGLVFLRIAGV